MYFCVYFHETGWSIVLLHCNVLVRIQDEDCSSLNGLRSVPSVYTLLEALCKFGVISSLNVW